MQERILVVLTTRGSGGSTEPPFPVSAGATVFDLGPLSGSDTRWLARWLDGSVGDERRAALVERAGGNPLFLAELLRHGGTGDHVPESAWAAVQARMDSATESVRRAAHIAAVLGPRVKPDAFSAIASDAASLEELSAVGLGREHIGGWRFHHALFYEAIYASIVDTRRAELHAMAARYYRERDEVAWAHHLERAGSKEAASAFAAAAESQRRVGAFAQVLALVERGIAPGTLPAVRLTLELLRASALNGLGRASDALEALAQAAPLAAQQNDQVRLELERAASLRALDRQTDALEALAYAEAGARATRATTLLAEIEYQRGSVLFPIGDVDGSLRAHRASIEHARTAGAANVEARALSGVGDAHYAAGRISEARESFCQAEELAGSLGMTRLALSAEGMQAVMIAFDLDLARCVRRCLDVAGRAQSIDALHVELFTRCGACFALVCMARWQELHAEASRATALAKAIGARRFEALARGYSSLAHARAGRIVEGETQLELARALRDDSGPAFSDGMLVAAELALVVDVARKRELVLSGLERLRPPSMFHSTLMSLVAFLGTAIELGDQELLRACVSLPRPQQPVPLWQLVHDIGAALTDGAPTGANAPRASVAGTRARAERAQFGVLGNDGHLTGTEP